MAKRRFRAENDHPSINADEKIAGEWQHHQHDHQITEFFPAAGDQQRQRISHGNADYRGECGDNERFQEYFEVNEIAEEELIGFDRQTGFFADIARQDMNRRQAAKFAWQSERSQHHDRARGGEEYQQEQQRWRADEPFDETAGCLHADKINDGLSN